MKSFFLLLLGCLFISAQRSPAQPIRLHPDNGHYFLFRGKPTALITSGEHYGSVLNLDFDYLPYLDELHTHGLNYTRIFTGAYVEIPGSFNIQKNTLAPLPNRFLAPWKRSDTPGYANGGNRFDLNQWDEAYFQRLRDFVSQASKRGIVVEVTLFSSLYVDNGWKYSPLHPANNVNQTDSPDRKQVQTLNNGNLLGYQEKMVRKIVQGLKSFDNVFYEIQNEPWADRGNDLGLAVTQPEKEANMPWQRKVEVADPASLEWQRRIAFCIQNEENSLSNKHLIAQNVANFRAKADQPDPGVSIFNFHYAHPQAVTENYALNKVIGFDESGFAGSSDSVYRQQAWRFMLSGGGLFNSLDYSFTTERANGTDKQQAPGGGSTALRSQLKVLKDFLFSFDFVRMKPDSVGEPAITLTSEQPRTKAYGLAQPGKAYAVYFEGGGHCEAAVELPAGKYREEWMDPQTGRIAKRSVVKHPGGKYQVKSPDYADDIALRLVRTGR